MRPKMYLKDDWKTAINVTDKLISRSQLVGGKEKSHCNNFYNLKQKTIQKIL